MEVILLEKVHNLGKLGDRVKVRPGYARNFLIPEKMAVPASEANVQKLETMRAELEKAQAEALAKAEARAAALKDAVVTVAARAGEEGKLFGSVGTADIAEAFSKAGTEVEKREVRMPTGPIRTLGDHAVELHLHADVNVAVTVRVVAESEIKA
ncbi:MAG: 50S ribosomal protein L9 [Gammaproteobacteria bacterium]|nr:50S ribosomal protein L9 [Gammaproteobacteria bacterium]